MPLSLPSPSARCIPLIGLGVASALACAQPPATASHPAPTFASAAAPDSFLVDLATSRGRLTIAVYRQWAPQGVDRFYYLIKHRFFDQARFFRVVAGFVAQFGLPADPRLGESLDLSPLADDAVRQTNAPGTLAFASAGPNTRTSQLFVNLRDNAWLDTLGGFGFAPIGRIIEGAELPALLTGEYDGENDPSQDSIRVQGNAYLIRLYPHLDYIQTARVVREWRATHP